jgi:hypothetical protein
MKTLQRVWQAIYSCLEEIGRERARRAEGLWY